MAFLSSSRPTGGWLTGTSLPSTLKIGGLLSVKCRSEAFRLIVTLSSSLRSTESSFLNMPDLGFLCRQSLTGRALPNPVLDAFDPFPDPLGRSGKAQTNESRRPETVAGNSRHLDIFENLPGDLFGGPQFGKITKQVKRPLRQNTADLRNT